MKKVILTSVITTISTIAAIGVVYVIWVKVGSHGGKNNSPTVVGDAKPVEGVKQ